MLLGSKGCQLEGKRKNRYWLQEQGSPREFAHCASSIIIDESPQWMLVSSRLAKGQNLQLVQCSWSPPFRRQRIRTANEKLLRQFSTTTTCLHLMGGPYIRLGLSSRGNVLGYPKSCDLVGFPFVRHHFLLAKRSYTIYFGGTRASIAFLTRPVNVQRKTNFSQGDEKSDIPSTNEDECKNPKSQNYAFQSIQLFHN